MGSSSNDLTAPRSAVVIGGGIAGLTAARALAIAGVPDVTLLEASDTLGGKLRTITIEGIPLELGADSFLAMKPEAVALARDLGLGLELEEPGPLASQTYLLRGGTLRRLPRGLAMGVPTGLGPLIGCVRDGIIGPLGALRAGIEPLLPRDADRARATVAQVSRARLGRQVADRLIAPLVGGVFGAPADEVGFCDAFPQMASTRSLVLAMARRPPADPNSPIFMTVRQGLQAMVEALTEDLALRGVAVRTAVAPTRVARNVNAGNILVSMPGRDDHVADAVIIATPAPIAAGLLRDELPSEATAHLAEVTSHPSAVLLLRYPKGALGRDLDGGGYLVTPEERSAVAACTWLTTKWPHHPWSDPWVRAIVTDQEHLRATDDALKARVVEDIGAALRTGLPSQAVMHRWHEAIPVYSPGHRDRMRSVLASLPPRVALAGAAYQGPGIPDCIRTAYEASERVLTPR